jgi:hypothetical protein
MPDPDEIEVGFDAIKDEYGDLNLMMNNETGHVAMRLWMPQIVACALRDRLLALYPPASA